MLSSVFVQKQAFWNQKPVKMNLTIKNKKSV